MACWSWSIVCRIFLVLGQAAWVFKGTRTEDLTFDSSAEEWTTGANETEWRNCSFEGKCRCTNSVADCSFTNLTFVPLLPNEVKLLNFSHNHLTSIDHDDFFLNVTKIIGLDLSKNNLSNISAGAFQSLTSLKWVFLSYNYKLAYRTLYPVFNVSTLEKLQLVHSDLGPVPVNLFQTFPLPKLQQLILHENRLGGSAEIRLDVFRPLSNLQTLGLATNLISAVVVNRPIHLQRLELQANGIFNFPQTCVQGTRHSLYPNLTHWLLVDNRIRYLPYYDTDFCLPRLLFLQLNENCIQHIVPFMFNRNRFPQLKELQLRDMVKSIDEYAFNNTSIEIISLAFNQLNFAKKVHLKSFRGLSNLSTLDLTYNSFSTVNLTTFLSLFSNLRKLRYLGLANTYFSQISQAAFSIFPMLKKLDLFQNEISDIPDGAFDLMSNLTTITLYNNRISVVRATTFSEETRRRLTMLDLSRNPFVCSCDLVWFQKWYLHNATLFDQRSRTYECENIPQTTVKAFYVGEQECLLSRDAYTMLVVTISVLFSTLAVFFVLYRYRWHLRLILYESFRGGSEGRRLRLQSRRFKYDVFVSYAAQDLDWVRAHLMPELEGRLGLKLCVHQRDFLPGVNIVDNISDCVEASKNILMVFSPHFASSHWCQFELALCLRHVLEQDDHLVVVCLQDPQTHYLTPAMLSVVKTTTFLEWGDNPDITNSFWGRLHVSFTET